MADLSDAFNEIAWHDFILFASKDKKILAAYTKDTGQALDVEAEPIESMIDKATGAADARQEAFIAWVTDNLWGLEDAPEAYREHRKQLEKKEDQPHACRE